METEGGDASGAVPVLLYAGRIKDDRVYHLALGGVRRYASARGWEVEVAEWYDLRRRTYRNKGETVGLVVEGSDLPVDLPQRMFARLPVVFLNCPEAPTCPRFARMVFDNVAVARAAFRELSANVPSAFAVVGYWRGPRHWSVTRQAAFAELVSKSGSKCHAFEFRERADRHAATESRRLAAWLSALPRNCAVFAVNDDTSAVVSAAATAAGLVIPQDFTLLGVDNDPAVCETSEPTLSSLQMDFENAGFQAAKRLDELCAGVPASTPPEDGEARVAPLMAVRRKSTRGRGRREKRILDAMEQIRQEACDGLTAARLSSRFRGSRKHFERRFREATGHSVLDEILHVRLDRVLAMLARSDTPISAISDFCGFGTHAELRRIFADRFGTSMRQWRKNHSR